MRISFFLTVALFIGFICPCQAKLTVDNLRCEYQNDPMGIDVVKPRLSWIPRSDERGQKQTAYQVVVASTLENLKQEKGDLWDSGRIDSDQTIHVEYTGKPLETKMRCFWKVRVWDKQNHPSPWSKTASWTMGLLKPSDWGNAKWIGYRDPKLFKSVEPHNGYHSGLLDSPDSTKWVVIDLGQNQKINAVQLHPSRPFDYVDTPGFLFPVRFKIEVAQKADFSDAIVVSDHSEEDVPNPGTKAPVYEFKPVEARYVRLMVNRLTCRDDKKYGLTLAEMRVFAGKKNVAKSKTVTVSDTIETIPWSKDKLVDGRLKSEGGSNVPVDWLPTMVRKDFTLQGPIKRAVVSVTGLGLYELRINGRRVGDHILAPEWTSYRSHIQYQTYDVTELIKEGNNAIGAQMGGGWWNKMLIYDSQRPKLQFCFLMRLDVELADGTTHTIVTDPSWLGTSDGPIRRSGIFFGETYDATKEMPGWDQSNFANTGWKPVQVLPHPDDCEQTELVAQCNEPIRVMEELPPVKITEPKPGVYVFDLGQNMAGWCRLKTNAPVGTKINVRYAERLKEDGTIYTDNLRGAQQINEYTWRGGEAELEPHFTYHGFPLR